MKVSHSHQVRRLAKYTTPGKSLVLPILVAVALVHTSCSSSGLSPLPSNTAQQQRDPAREIQDVAANLPSREGDDATEAMTASAEGSIRTRTYSHLSGDFSPEPCAIILTLMNELADVLGAGRQLLLEAEIEHLDRYYPNWVDYDEVPSIELNDSQGRILGSTMEQMYDIYLRHFWLWDWLHRDCSAQFAEVHDVFLEDKMEMQDLFRRIDRECRRLLDRGCASNWLGAIGFACSMRTEKEEECAPNVIDGALVAENRVGGGSWVLDSYPSP